MQRAGLETGLAAESRVFSWAWCRVWADSLSADQAHQGSREREILTPSYLPSPLSTSYTIVSVRRRRDNMVSVRCSWNIGVRQGARIVRALNSVEGTGPVGPGRAVSTVGPREHPYS